MGTPRAFRFLAKTMTRSPLADTDPVPFEPKGANGKGGQIILTRPDGRPLTALVVRMTVAVTVGNREDYVERRVATYNVADLPRMPKHGDWVHVDGERLSVADTKTTRVGLVDCYLAD